MKIAVALARYSVSGVPLAQMRLARALAAAGHDVDLLVGYKGEQQVLPEVPGVKTILLGRAKVRQTLLPLVRYLRAQRPDIVFTAEDHLNALVLAAATLSRSKAKITASSRVTPFDTYSNRPFTKRWLLKQVMRLFEARADVLTCVSEDMVLQYRQVFPRARHVSVYNIVADSLAAARMREPLQDPWVTERTVPLIVAAGSLVPWKGFDDLIRAAGLLRRRGRRFRLAILGEGPLRADLEALVAEEELGEQVRLIGHVDNPLKYFARADVFALSSHVEGLPNVLVEAMMCGCTPVSVDCPTGPREVLQDGRLGYLVPVHDTAALADGLERALDHPMPKDLLAQGVEPFSEAVVLERHFALLGVTPP